MARAGPENGRRAPPTPGAPCVIWSGSAGHQLGAAPGELRVGDNRNRDAYQPFGVFVRVVPAEHELAAFGELDQVIFDGASFGTPVRAGTPEEEEYLGLPGLLTPDQVATLLSKRQADQVAAARRQPAAAPSLAPAGPRTAGERRIHLRRQLNALVAAHHHRTGQAHGKIHAELRRLCGGPPSAQATIEQLEERITTIQTF